MEYVGNNPSNKTNPERGYGIEYVELSGVSFPDEFTVYFDVMRKCSESYTSTQYFGNTSDRGGFALGSFYSYIKLNCGLISDNIKNIPGGSTGKICRNKVLVEVKHDVQRVKYELPTGTYSSVLNLPYVSTEDNILLMCDRNPKKNYGPIYGDVYSFWVKETYGMYVVDLIPCVKNGIACFYDKVSGKIFENSANKGNLVAGPRIV